jgi:hypothetical protein
VSAPNESFLLMPAQVKRAAVLLWTSLSIAICRSVYLLVEKPPRSIAVTLGILALMSFIYGLCGVVIGAIRRGRNWARVLLLVMIIAGCALAAVRPARYFAGGAADIIVFIVQSALQITAICLAFSQSASSWYRRD